MKIKPIYLYLLGFIIVVLAVIIFSINENKDDDRQVTTSEQQMPDDDVHKELQSPTENPTKDNVAGNIRHQMEMLQKAVEENPDDTSAVRQYADLLSAAHQPEKAIEYYLSILKKDSRRVDVLSSLTYTYYKIGAVAKAEGTIKQILNINPEDQEALYNLGAIAATKGDTAEAREIWSDLLKRFPEGEVAEVTRKSLNRL